MLEQAEQIGLGFLEADIEPTLDARVAPFHEVPPSQARPGVNCVPLYSLEAAAGGFGSVQEPEPDAWVVPHGRWRSGPGLFVGRVVGESMNRRVPSGSYCLFRHPVTGSRQGRVVLVQHRDLADPEHGGSYTVKLWESDKVIDEHGWRHHEIRLVPDSSDPAFLPIVLHVEEEGVNVIAELIEVLPGLPPA